ncbi:MAG: hypothetical protein HY308_02165 [Gammaproteobacteria bacterium]|nr:hypothetical protein [Gammaproteobacteria bacterium]
MKLKHQLRTKERQLELAQAALQQSTAEFKHVLHGKLASKTALVMGFSGGWLMGFWRSRRQARRPKAADGMRERLGLTPHWLAHHVVWPAVLATVYDYLLSRRPNKQQMKWQ